MPTAAKRPCLAPRCPNLVSSGYCTDHAELGHRYDRKRASDPIRKLYWTERWRKYSKWRLRGHPFCAHCGGRATLTDHIVPAHEAPERGSGMEKTTDRCAM